MCILKSITEINLSVTRTTIEYFGTSCRNKILTSLQQKFLQENYCEKLSHNVQNITRYPSTIVNACILLSLVLFGKWHREGEDDERDILASSICCLIFITLIFSDFLARRHRDNLRCWPNGREEVRL